MAALNAMHSKMLQQLAKQGGRVDAMFFCPHTPDDHCDCRKPAPGLLLQIGERYGIDLSAVPAVGDSLRDLQAAAAAGCEPHLVRTGKAATLSDTQVAHLASHVPGTTVHADLAAFAEWLMQRERVARGASHVADSGPGGLGG